MARSMPGLNAPAQFGRRLGRYGVIRIIGIGGRRIPSDEHLFMRRELRHQHFHHDAVHGQEGKAVRFLTLLDRIALPALLLGPGNRRRWKPIPDTFHVPAQMMRTPSVAHHPGNDLVRNWNVRHGSPSPQQIEEVYTKACSPETGVGLWSRYGTTQESGV
jgi:hypothetical protein